VAAPLFETPHRLSVIPDADLSGLVLGQLALAGWHWLIHRRRDFDNQSKGIYHSIVRRCFTPNSFRLTVILSLEWCQSFRSE
jgi:hypothetical protein